MTTEKMTTKEKIIVNSLRLFADKGFDGVSVRDISSSVGIKESSLYNHFKNKQDIFDRVVDFCFEQSREYFKAQNLPFDNQDDFSMYINIDTETLTDLVVYTFKYFFDDEYNTLFRQLLLKCQNSNEKAREIYKNLYMKYPIDFQSRIFGMLVENGEFRKEDPNQIAVEFYGVMFMLIHTCDSMEQAEPMVRHHVAQFVRNYHI